MEVATSHLFFWPCLFLSVTVDFGKGVGTGNAVVLGSDLTSECKFQPRPAHRLAHIIHRFSLLSIPPPATQMSR
jgi:hypothetical protein